MPGQVLLPYEGPIAQVTLSHPYRHADSAEQREGILAFLEKRKPEF